MQVQQTEQQQSTVDGEQDEANLGPGQAGRHSPRQLRAWSRQSASRVSKKLGIP